MFRASAALVLAGGFGSMLYAQSGRIPEFEVASLKPSPPPTGTRTFAIPGMQGGPGTADPTRVRYQNMPLLMLLSGAFGVNWADIVGPAWVRNADLQAASDKYDIEAILPPQTTKEQLQLMLQNLLAERFAIQTHREKKTVPAYALAVAKDGPKIKPDTAPDDPEAAEKVNVRVRAEDGFPVTPPGYNGLFVRVISGYTRVKFIRYSMEEFAKWTRTQTKRPSIDRTGLTARYSFYLEFGNDLTSARTEAETAPELVDRGQSFPAALEKQLGLKLVPENAEIELLVIDHINRIPSGN